VVKAAGGDAAEFEDGVDASTPNGADRLDGDQQTAAVARTPGAEGIPEANVWEGRFSPKAMIASFAVLVIGSTAGFALIAFAALRDMRWLLFSVIVALPVIWIAQFLRLAMRNLSAHYRLTNRRLFIERGVLHRHKDQLDLARIEDVRILQHVLHRLLDVGSIEVLSSDRRLRRLVMEGISDADDLAEVIRELAAQRRSEPASPVAAAKS